MSEVKLEFVGKQVKDIYGTFVGRVVGITTDIDGSIESVGVDCGSAGLKHLAYEQLVIQGDYVIFIPRWRLDAQKLLRQKSLTLKRLKALQDIVSENDTMKEDAELVYVKYEKRLHELEEYDRQVNEKLQSRLAESKSIRAVLFDAKLQYRSNEMTEETYEQVKMHTNELIEHINNERTEIANVRTKLSLQTLENISSATSAKPEAEQAPAAKEPEAKEVAQVEASVPSQEEKVAVTANSEARDAAWISQVISK